MSAIGVAIAGAGNWASYAHLPALGRLPHFKVIGIAAATQESAANTAARFDIPFATTSTSDLLDNPNVDLVVVLARVPQHAPLVMDAIAAGKNVYCEWPLGVNAAQARQMADAAKSAKVHHAVGLQRRLAPSVRWFRSLVQSGYVGDVRSVRLHVSEPHLHGERVKAWAAFSADPSNFSNLYSIYGGHFLDVIRSIFGVPAEISAHLLTQFPEIRVKETGEIVRSTSPDQLVACGRFSDGAALSIHIEGGKHHGSGVSLAVTGTRGDLMLSGSSAFRNTQDYQVAGAQVGVAGWQVLPVPRGFSWVDAADLPAAVSEVAHVYEAMARRMIGADSEGATFEDAVQLHIQLDLIERASRTGQRQVL